jgi:hypothetical protein
MKATGFGSATGCVGCTGTDPSKINGFVAGIQATVVDAAAVPAVISVRELTYTGGTVDTVYCMMSDATEAPAVATTKAPVAAPTSGASSIKASLLLLVSWVAFF